MECNKEEAIRAKGIAEIKMQNKDFVGARKIVLKAQQLFPDLENVSQMLTVCEVNCSAGIKVNGETDWYGILQVEPTTDESTIKKQYRKLALLLHPDKNKYGGAEAAFKLVGEAHMTLSDRGKRSMHDMKRGASFRTVAVKQSTQQSNRTSYTKKQPGVASNFGNSTSTQFNGLNQPQPPPFSSAQTFWTICPFCGIRYQYYQNIMNRALRCQSCMKSFIAYDLNAQAVPSAAPWNRAGIPIPKQENPVPGAHCAGQKSYFGSASGTEFQGKMGGGSTASEPWSTSGFNTEFGSGPNNKAREDDQVDRDTGKTNDVKFEKVKLQEVNKREHAVKSSAGNGSQKRGRKIVVESSDSDSSDSDVVIEDSHPAGQNTGTAGSYPRRSTRQKQNVSYNENQSDDDDFVSPKFKRLRKGGTSFNTEQSDKEFREGDANGVNVQSSETAVSKDKKANIGKGGSHSESLPNGMHEGEQGAGKREQSLNSGASSKANASVDFSSEASPDPDIFSYPDPEFCDFEKERDESEFAADQIWAIYDNLDAMPRYYVRIRQVYGPKFKLWFSWLEYDPTSKAESLWCEGDLPIGCGSFKLGKSEYTQDQRMFSHLMPWRKGTKRNSYVIYPRKGEVWALFKNWDIEWVFYVDSNRHYEYEVVEVLSDFTEGDVISVVRLVKIQGFVSLFVQATDKEAVPLKIHLKDILKFSHKIPSYRMTGAEREGVPQGSLELDCASLPTNFAEMFASVNLENIKAGVESLNDVCNGVHSKSAGTEEELLMCTTNKNSFELNEKNVLEEMQRSRDISSDNGKGACRKGPNHSSTTQHAAAVSGKHVESEPMTPKQQVGAKEKNVGARDPNTNNAPVHHTISQPSSTSPKSYVYPDSEFHNFEEERSIEKFEGGQIWALYSDIDRYPKYYGRIRKVELERFKVHITWLEGYSAQVEEKEWLDEQLPIGCGTFKIAHERCTFDTTDTFSHVVQAKPMGNKNHYVIYPSIGEIWAVYKNWRVGWSLSDLEDSEFDVVEILDCNSSGFKVLVLTKVKGYSAVFMAERRGVTASTMDIPFAERLRFSHQIPAFRLTEERGGKLRGYWELDPASVPDVLLFTNSN